MEQAKRKRIEAEQASSTATYNISHFDLTTMLPSDLSVLSSEYEEILPITSTNNILEFVVPSSPSFWVSLSDTLLCLTLQIVQANGNKLLPSSKTSLGNFPLGCIFESCDIRLDGINITSGGNLHSFSSYINRILYSTCESIRQRGPLEGLYLNNTSLETDATSAPYVALQAVAQKENVEIIGK